MKTQKKSFPYVVSSYKESDYLCSSLKSKNKINQYQDFEKNRILRWYQQQETKIEPKKVKPRR